MGDDRFKGDEEAVGGPAGAIAFGLIGLKTGADAGLLAGAISGGFAGSDKGEEIAQNRESNN